MINFDRPEVIRGTVFYNTTPTRCEPTATASHTIVQGIGFNPTIADQLIEKIHENLSTNDNQVIDIQ
jgi:hypothetical protein